MDVVFRAVGLRLAFAGDPDVSLLITLNVSPGAHVGVASSARNTRATLLPDHSFKVRSRAAAPFLRGWFEYVSCAVGLHFAFAGDPDVTGP